MAKLSPARPEICFWIFPVMNGILPLCNFAQHGMGWDGPRRCIHEPVNKSFSRAVPSERGTSSFLKRYRHIGFKYWRQQVCGVELITVEIDADVPRCHEHDCDAACTLFVLGKSQKVVKTTSSLLE